MTGQKIYWHTEYAGALAQLDALAKRFEPNAIVIFRGGGTNYIEIRDVPEMLMMPLRFAFGVDALVVKSEQPGRYANDIAAQVGRWQAAGRPVYLALSANGGSLSLPGLALQPVGDMTLRLAEFEQLSAQKPHNVGEVLLPFALYRVQPTGTASQVDAVEASTFMAQVRGFYRPEPTSGFVWTNDDALLRLRITAPTTAPVLHLRAAGGPRPAGLGAASLCVAVRPEEQPWHGAALPRPDDPPFTAVGCIALTDTPNEYTLPLDSLPQGWQGSVLVRLQSAPWVPAEADPAMRDQRILGVQIFGASLR